MGDSKRITRNLSFIKKNITEIDNVIDILIEEGILGMAERNIILSDEDPIHSVLETILKKQAYAKFIKALQKTGNERIISRLDATDISVDKESTVTQQHEQDDVYTDEEYKNDRAHILQKDLENLIKENDNLKLQQAQIRKELNVKQQKLLELNREACSYQKQNLELSQRLSGLKKSDNLINSIDELEGELKKKDSKNSEIRKEVDEKNDEITQLRKELEELRKEVDEKTDQIDMLTREMKYLRGEHMSARSERRELKLKIENLNNNLEERMKSMMNVITESKTTRTPRQSTFTLLAASSRSQSKDSIHSRENSSIFPSLNSKKNSPKVTENKATSPRANPRTKVSRPQQFISPQFIFTPKNNGSIKPQWK